MPCYSGIDIARKIREHPSPAIIIFLSSHTGYAIDGYLILKLYNTVLMQSDQK